MRILLKISLWICISFLSGWALVSCTDNTEVILDENSVNQYDIYFGSFGGLCGHSDSMSITMNLDINLTYKDFCTDTDFENEGKLTQEEYSSLISLLSKSSFSDLNHNSCDRCVDGLDTFLHVVGDDGFTHRIVYGHDDDISSIDDFIDRLNELRESLKPE